MVAALPCELVGLLGSALALRLVELRAVRLWELARLALELNGLEALLAGLDASCSSCNIKRQVLADKTKLQQLYTHSFTRSLTYWMPSTLPETD